MTQNQDPQIDGFGLQSRRVYGGTFLEELDSDVDFVHNDECST